MKKGKLSYRILTSFLALLMVFTSLPIANSYAAVSEENKNLGSVSSITDKKAQIKTEGTETTVLFNNELELNWVANGEGGVERGKDGWWVGIKLTAPKFADDEFYNILSKTKYQSKSYGSDEWKTAEGKSFWENQDSDKNDTEKNTERHIELWAFVDETSLAKAQKENENIRTEWRFDWNTENTDASAGFDAEQTVAVEIEPSAVTLKKDGKQVYPIVLKDVTAITDKTVEPTTEIKDGISQTTVLFDKEIVLDWADADEGIKRGKDGWWAGVKLNAPDLGSDILSKAMYQSQSYGGELVTGKKFWDARDSKDDSSDGEYITLWAFVNEENLNTAKAAGEVIETLWNFDWNSDDVLDQSVVIQIKPDKVILKNGNEQVYPATDLGTVEGITGTVAVDGNTENSVTASYNEKVTLQWSRANKDIGRNADGWWAGIKVTAPSTKVSEVENVKYQSKAYGSDEWQTAKGKMFWNNQDSDKNNPNDGVERYITLWAYVKDQAMLDAAKADDKKILTQWRFDWNNDGVYEQYVNFELDPNNIVLDWTERYKLDTEVPVITVENSADDKEKVQWSADSATISGTVGDFQVDGYDSGIKEVYCLNSKSEKVDGFEYKDGTFRLTVNEEGELEYTIVASDNSGKEKTQKVYAKVDKTEPIINSVKIESDSVELTAVKSKDGAQIVKIDAKDVQSGIVSIVADGKDVTEKSEFEVTANGTYTVEVTDGVGKKATKEIVVDNFDDAAPSASLNLPKTSKVNEFIDKIKKLLKIEDGKIDSTVILTVKDNGSDGENPDYVQIEKAYYYLYNVTSGSEKTLEEQAAGISKEFVEQNGIEFKDSQDITLKVGESIVFVYAVDKAGNELFDYSNGFVFEETKPQITVKNGETEIADNAEQLIKMNAAPDFVISVHDATEKGEFVSGIQEVSISVDDGEPVILNEVKDTENVAAGGKGELVFSSKSKDFPDFSNPGIYTVTVTAKDMCGNESTFTFNYKYDNIAPVFSDLTYNKLEGETDWSHSDSVTFTVKDQYTDGNKNVVDASVEKVEYVIVESADADLTSESLVWKEVTGTNGKFALEAEDVKDGKYTMYVAVKYTDDCGNETEPAVQQVDIKKDTAEPVFDHFDLSVDKNNAVEGFINHLSFGTFCKESVIIRAYAKDAVSGLCGTAIMNYKANGETKSDSDVKLVRLTDDSGYYEYKLPLKDESEENIVYSEISFIISDNYIKDGKYSNTTDPKLSERKTSVENKEITDNISDITLENIAPVFGDVTFGTEKHIEVEGKNVYNGDVVQTIPITDSESGISSIDVNVKVNETENKKTFVVAENEIINEATIKYSASEQKLTFICNGKETNIEIKGLETKDNNSVSVTVKATDNAGNVSDEYIADYVIDNKAPEITDIESNAAEYIHDDVSYTFKTDELHINNEGAGVVTYTYNDGEEQTVPTDKDLKVTFTKEGKYVIKNIVVKDLLENETTVESKDFGVLTEFVIDKTAPTVKEVEFTTETGNSIVNFFKYGIFAKEVVKVSAAIQNTDNLDEDFVAPIKNAILSIGEKEITDFKYDSENSCWIAEFIVSLDTEETVDLTVTDMADNSASFAVTVNDSGEATVSPKTDDNSGANFKSEDDKPYINIPKTADSLKNNAIIIDDENKDKELVVNSYNGKLWFNKDFIIPIIVNDTGNQNENAPVSGIRFVKITVNNEEYLSEIYNYGDQDYNFDSELYYEINTAQCTAKDDYSYEIVVKTEDFSGNTSEEVLTIYRDDVIPSISANVNAATNITDENKVVFYSGELKTEYGVTDNESGVSSVKFTVKGNDTSLGEAEFGVDKDCGITNAANLKYVYDPINGTITEYLIDGETKEKKAEKEVGTLESSDDNKYEVVVSVTDNADNKTDDNNYTYTYHIDNKAPEITISCDNIDEFINQNVKYTFNLNGEKHYKNDEDSGTAELIYDYNETAQDSDKDISGSYDGTVLSKEFSADGKYIVKEIKVIDLLGNETTVESKDFGVLTQFVIDKIAPEVTAVDFKVNTENKVINFFKYGIFANDVVKVTATIQNKNELPEGTEAEKVASFTAPLTVAELSIGEKAKEVKDFAYDSKTNCWTAVFTIDLNKTGLLDIKVEDEATNNSSVDIKKNDKLKITYDKDSTDGSILETNFYLSENTAPIISFEKGLNEEGVEESKDIYISSNETEKTEYKLVRQVVEEKTWFNKNVVVPITVKDDISGKENGNPISGIKNVKIYVNDSKMENKPFFEKEYKDEYDTTEKYLESVETVYEYNVDTSYCAISPDGSYEIKVVATDFAGNEKTETFTVYKDTETPYVDFAFSGEGNQDSLNKDGKVELVELKDSVYGYYFSEDTQVTITAADKNDKVKDSEGKEFNPKAIGVESITYYAVDITTNNIVIKRENVKVDENNQVVFTVPANFKGQIYAYATDYVGNNFTTALNHQGIENNKLITNPTGSGSDCVIPDKTIVEGSSKHSEETHVSYEVLTKTNTKDASGFDLYNKAVSVKVTITDTYSGIRSGSVTVTSDENRNDENSNTKFDITKDMNSSKKEVGQTINGWTIDDKDGNLVTKISKTITITRNSNNILVSTSMEDRAGNKTENVLLKKFSIDTVAPEITVRYSNNSASDGKYFKANRTATITVAERNFDPSLVTAQVNGRNVSLNWNGSYSDNLNKEGRTYTATITYGSDGDYKFGISCKDRAGNADNSPRKYAGQTAPTDFVIDKTAPVVTVSNTSTASPQNGNYYSKPVQVTITVVEHNWDPAKFRITYAENDRNVSRSLSWSNSGDTHTATFTCDSSTGLKYTIDYALADKAANNCVFVQDGSRVSDYRPDEFYVDQTIPEIKFTGAVDGSHNNGTVESGVVLSDTYYDRVEVTLTGKRRGVVLQQTYTDTNIDITEFVDMSRDKDDYYTISVVAYDKAGNRNENPATRSYSVNRKGSMFVLSADAKKLNAGTNSKNIVNGDIVIYEYNVDEISSAQVELWKNGNVTVLSRGSGYTVSTNDNQNGYFCYTYYIKQSLFADDAAYRVYITTKDEAGNTSTNTSKNSAAMSNLDKNNGEAPVLSFIKDTTPPAIDINLDITKTDTFGGYQIKQAAYVVTFTLADAGSGLDPDSVTVTAGNGDKIEVLDIIQNEDGSYSVTLSGIYSNLTFSFKDNAGNEDSTLVFNKVTVSANPFVRLVANTPLFIGLIVAFVAIAIIIIILLAKRKKDNDDEDENETAKEKKKNK